MQCNAGRGLVRCVGVSMYVGGVHDVMYSAGDARSTDGGNSDLDGGMRCCSMSPISWAVVINMLYWWQGSGMDEMTADPV